MVETSLNTQKCLGRSCKLYYIFMKLNMAVCMGYNLSLITMSHVISNKKKPKSCLTVIFLTTKTARNLNRRLWKQTIHFVSQKKATRLFIMEDQKGKKFFTRKKWEALDTPFASGQKCEISSSSLTIKFKILFKSSLASPKGVG